MTQSTGSTGKWLIKGTLTTASPLHIGCGDTTVRDKILVNEKTGKNIEINAVVTTGKDKPDYIAYIPGSTIKGIMRAWLKNVQVDKEIIKEIFGSDDPGDENAVGGKAEFHDAFIGSKRAFADNDDKRPPYWSEERQTGVSVSVTINRQTGTARAERLFHQEFVPAGVRLAFVITGQDLTKEEVGYLLHALEDGCAANAKMPLAMGSGTGDGYGRFTWQLEQVKELQQAGVAKWIEEGCKEAGADIIVTHGNQWNLSEFDKPTFRLNNDVTIGITLDFAGSFLVNDPSRISKDKSDKTVDSRPRLDHNGLMTLPGSSFRGALRSHAEKIIRTVGGWACRVDDLDNGCKAVSEASEIQTRCLACRMFGAPGWKTLVDIAPFTLATPEKLIFTQDFIAVDRFTGGVKKSAKFDAESLVKPRFEGKLTIDASRIEPWQIGLLALLLRDIEEGDITFGFGSSKGYGSCTADASGLDIGLLRDRTNFQSADFLNKSDNDFIDACIKSFIEACTPATTSTLEG